MNKPTIIFFDIDGTLLDFGKKDLSPKTREALLKLRENGIRICIALAVHHNEAFPHVLGSMSWFR